MPTVAILVGDLATEERLASAWVPVHEFSHLATPFIDRDDAWLSEGIATYYQEVLRARAGLQTAEQAWSNLDDGFSRGDRDGSGRSIAEESRAMSETAAFRRVYWAGAAIALMADLEIRDRSDGERSLDDALEHLNACCATRDRPMTGQEAIERLDEVEAGAFGTIARRHLGSSEFPRLEVAYRRLGLARSASGEMRLLADPEPRALRDAVMAPRSDLRDVPPCGPWFARE